MPGILGYTVKPHEEVDYPLAHIAVANGDATLLANHWKPHPAEFYKAAGGDAKLYRKGVYTEGAVQGYIADKHKITHLDQLKDPKLARLFDTDGGGKASLSGPNAGWGGEAVVNHQLKAFKQEDTVRYTQGNCTALISETVARFKAGKPALYCAWTPHWLSNVMVTAKDAIWLQEPFSAMPGVQAGTDTALPNGRNYGFPLYNGYIVANRAWAERNPAAAELFKTMRVPIADISAQNRLLNERQNTEAHVQRHVDIWIRAHQKTFGGWIDAARTAALGSGRARPDAAAPPCARRVSTQAARRRHTRAGRQPGRCQRRSRMWARQSTSCLGSTHAMTRPRRWLGHAREPARQAARAWLPAGLGATRTRRIDAFRPH